MWIYEQTTGYLIAPDGAKLEPAGYAGHGAGLNNPAMQSDPDVGPLPQGFYTVGDPITDPHVGKYALPLIPDASNQMYGRKDFFEHGDEIQNPGKHLASDGCIIQCLANRQRHGSSSDRRLQVVGVWSGQDPAATDEAEFGQGS